MNSSPHPVDTYVGARLRARRAVLGMTQENLGSSVGLTFQQIQKYERGTNRIVASRLYEFAKVLRVDISYFFDGFDLDETKLSTRLDAREKNNFEIEPLLTKSSIDMIRRYTTILDPVKKKLIQDLIRAFSSESDTDKEIKEEN